MQKSKFISRPDEQTQECIAFVSRIDFASFAKQVIKNMLFTLEKGDLTEKISTK